MSDSYHLRGRYFWIFVCLLLVLVVAPEPHRLLPRAEAATYTVTNLNDAGAGSLRQAIIDANNSAGADTINFSVTGTINLGSSLHVTDDVTINGAGITLDGNNTTRIMYNDSAAVMINDLTFQNGSDAFGGGAILNQGLLTITGSTFSANQAPTGPGGAIMNVAGDTLTITNTTFSGNTAGFGGAIANDGPLIITSSTFSGNTASTIGGTLYNIGTINDVVSSIIVDGDCSGTIPDGGNNLSFNATGCPGTAADPQLGPLQNNGGPTDTMLPSTDGPAVDAYAAPCATSTDQRGVPRPQGPSCDIGATEQDGSVMLAVSAVCNGPNLDVIITAGDDPFDITASAGQNTPVNGVSTGTTTINGPEKWDNLTVTETGGDAESINLGKFKCRTDERSVPLTPPHRSHTTNPFPLFSWTPISIANNYRVFVFDNKVAADRTVDIRQNSGGPTSMTLSAPLPDGRLFWRVRGRQNRVWSLWSVRFTLFKDPVAPFGVTAPLPTINLNSSSGDAADPVGVPTVGPAPTFPPPPNSR